MSYCSRFHLLDKIKLEHTVIDISKTEDHDVTSQWRVTVKCFITYITHCRCIKSSGISLP